MGEETGASGQGHTGTTKYPAEGAKVIANGGNEKIHDGVATEQSPASMYGGSEGTLKKSKG